MIHKNINSRQDSNLSKVKSTLLKKILHFDNVKLAELRKFYPLLSKEIQSFSSQSIQPSKCKSAYLSFAEERLWFLDQLVLERPIYNIPVAYVISGSLHVAALEQSLVEIVQRHQILRTTFPVVDGQPTRAIAPDISLTLPVIDLRELPPEQRNAEAYRYASEEAQQPFNLAQDPLLRVKLLYLKDAECVLLLNIHHIVSDGWSFDVFFRELTTLYTAFSTDKPSPLPELPIQYADFAHWQRNWLQGEVLESQLSYWKQQLGGSLPILQLPTDYLRPPVQTYPGAYQFLELPLDLTKALKALSQQESVTLFMTLLAAFQTLLSRYSGQEDIIVGTPIAGRNQVETEGLIGFFVNTLVIRTNLSGNQSFRQLLSQVREVTLGAYDHQDLPFEKLVEELQPDRDLSRSPLFQVMFVFQNTPSQPWELPGLTITPLEVHSGTAKFDLTLALEETSEGIKGGIEYNTNLFEAATITRMLGHFQTLLEGIVTNPQQRLWDLPLLTPAEQHQLLVEWNNTTTDCPNNICIHQLFEAQVERTPDAIAVVFENQQLTYQQLNRRANQLAHYLQKLGVKPDTLVGICVERSLEMLMGLLGILKAGGVYVPLDPAYPQERLAFMLQDIQAPVLLTQQQLVENLPAHEAQVVCLDTDWETMAREREENLEHEVTLDNLVYTIYTSGSTGKPKGIAMSHRCLSNLISWQLQNSTVRNGAKTLQFTSLSFDVSCQEIFSTWCSGGTLVLISEELRRDAVGLWRFIANEGIERLFLPFVALQQLAEVADTQGLIASSLLEIITAGEQLQITPQIANLFKQLKGCTLHNQYGPAESHVVTAFTLKGSPQYWPVLPPIGRPIANTQIYIFDSHLQPVPIGVPGELHIGGVGLARGYLNRPELTQEKFIPNPFLNSKFTLQNSKCDRLYKTGDLARYLPNGTIEFLGRLDNQVKLRGFRLELGEIETAIAQHPSIQQTVVTARVDNSGDKRLVAYIVLDPEQTVTTDELRRFLKQKLPDYMVPSAFVFLDTLPLTPNGKIDRRALPAPDSSRPDLEETFVAPGTPTEQQIADIWTQLLKLEQIGIHDNFFALGGHSLLATQVISRLRQGFGIELPLQTLFEAPTVSELSSRIETICWASQQSKAPVGDTTGDYEEGRL
jgi:amino acid adenylation domain-containing protein